MSTNYGGTEQVAMDWQRWREICDVQPVPLVVTRLYEYDVTYWRQWHSMTHEGSVKHG